MNKHLRFGLFLLSIHAACAMELQDVTDDGAQNSTTMLCTAIKNISHDADGFAAWKELKPSLLLLTDSAAKATVARTLIPIASLCKWQAKPLLCCFGGEKLFVPVVFTASTLFSTGVLFREMQSYGIGAQVAALAMGGTGIFGINYAGIASFLQKRKQDAALWNMASDMETTAAQLAPQEKV